MSESSEVSIILAFWAFTLVMASAITAVITSEAWMDSFTDCSQTTSTLEQGLDCVKYHEPSIKEAIEKMQLIKPKEDA